MKTYYLKTTDEQSLWLALESADLVARDYDPEDPLNQRPDDAAEDWEPAGAFNWRFTGVALDIIGTIYEPTGNMLTDDEGFEYPEMQPINGYHANMMAQDGIEGLPEITAPSTPYRKFAGE